jgi:hypothetical protein
MRDAITQVKPQYGQFFESPSRQIYFDTPKASTRTNAAPLQRMFPDGFHRSAIASANPTRCAATQVKFQHGQFPEPLPRQVHLDAALGRWALERHTFDAAMP